ncbi:MAG: hypothetical protein H6719_12975 [Sandaracinaceae bacterium]|nr:hypothetical protein [Sandaracinaceae bacterium]
MNDLFGPSLEASLEDLKSIYRILVDQFDAHPELEANTFLEALRNLLEDQAEAEGVDIDDDDAWDAWLHEPPLPEVVEPPTELLN